MPKPKNIRVNYVRTVKSKGLTEQSIGFVYSHEHSLEVNVSSIIGFVESIHDVKSVLSVVLEF